MHAHDQISRGKEVYMVKMSFFPYTVTQSLSSSLWRAPPLLVSSVLPKIKESSEKWIPQECYVSICSHIDCLRYTFHGIFCELSWSVGLYGKIHGPLCLLPLREMGKGRDGSTHQYYYIK